MLNDGSALIEVIKELHVTESTWYRWLNQYGSKEECRVLQTDQRTGEGIRLTEEVADGPDALQRHPQRGGEGKILSPEPRRRAVRMAMEKLGASERFACKVIGHNRSAFRTKKPEMGFEEAELRAAPRAVAVKHPAW